MSVKKRKGFVAICGVCDAEWWVTAKRPTDAPCQSHTCSNARALREARKARGERVLYQAEDNTIAYDIGGELISVLDERCPF